MEGASASGLGERNLILVVVDLYALHVQGLIHSLVPGAFDSEKWKVGIGTRLGNGEG